MARTNYSTYSIIKKQLIDMFRQETLEHNKLPSEAELAETLDISISTLREVLVVLALEGYITKKHGVGNFLHPSTLDFGSRSIFFVANLENSGYRVDVRLDSQEIIVPDKKLADMLQIDKPEEMLATTTIYLADGEPAICSKNHIPVSLFVRKTEKIEAKEYKQLHDMVWRYCRRNLAHSLNEYMPAGLPKALSGLFQLPEGTPIIANRQVFYDTYDEPVMYCLNYFYPNKYKVCTLQNWALGQMT